MHAWIKRIHMYLGLLNYVTLTVFGIAGLTATFEPGPRRPQPAAEARYEPFVAATFAVQLPFGNNGRVAAPSIVNAAHWYGTAFWPNVRNMSRLAAVKADAGDRFSNKCA